MESSVCSESPVLALRRVRPIFGVRVRRRGFSVDSAASTALAASLPGLVWSSVMYELSVEDFTGSGVVFGRSLKKSSC